MAEYKPGKMDIRAQEKTYAAFIRMSTWAAGIVIMFLVIIALANA